MREPCRVIVVTDPLCSWCWGTAAAIEAARRALADTVYFDLLFGGINVESTHPVGDYGRWRLARLWAEVAMVTGQPFAPAPSAEPFVYNSATLCAVLEAARDGAAAPPFELLQRLQYRFFACGEDVTSPEVVDACLESLGYDAETIRRQAASDTILDRVRRGFTEARSHGTHAMPSLVLETEGTRSLLAGGYVDTATLVATVEDALRKSSPPPA